ncbi:DNA cytosine methyltransferase [Aureimonas ureilytica]|uniref:DNA cytosine methyltransferase n=1 Tax=Aureimonas ureilytica TaxID=401562 RepID=UPI003CED7429
MILSLFSGAGGLDIGFEAAGFEVGLAFDKKRDSILSYNYNRLNAKRQSGHVADINELTLADFDRLYGASFKPKGVIGGPPCQSFSQANRVSKHDDPRHLLPLRFAQIVEALNRRNPIEFVMIENVTGLLQARHRHRLSAIEDTFRRIGFPLTKATLLATDFGTAQKRERLFFVGFNQTLYPEAFWSPPTPDAGEHREVTVRSKIADLPEPLHFDRTLNVHNIPYHPNHWCMSPKSPRFKELGRLKEGNGSSRSFKVLHWDRPSFTVAYGNREVHIHPNCHRRLSVYEALLLQGFPKDYVLLGSMSSQFAQVSEAVPPAMAQAVAISIEAQLHALKLTHRASLSDDFTVYEDRPVCMLT